MKKIIGISAFYHDSAATLIINGDVIAAAQEERFTRKKHDSAFPYNAIKFVLDYAKISLHEVDLIVFYEKPFLKFERLLETYVAFAPKGFQQFSKSMPIWLKEKLFQKNLLISCLQDIDKEFKDKEKILFSDHHLSHAASAFYPSKFNEAIIITADGVGEWATTTVAIGSNKNLQIKKEINFPHSLGLLYSAFTYYAGFKVNSGEYKLMGLAPYGSPKYSQLIKDNLIDIKSDGSFHMDQSYFNYATGLTMTNSKFDKLFNKIPRDPKKQEVTQFDMDIAASIQNVTEEVILKIARSAREEFNIPNLCLAGGVALNCVANGKIINEKIFDNVWIQPAAGDAGGSLGAALAVWHLELDMDRVVSGTDKMFGSFLGPKFSQNDVETRLKNINAKFSVLSDEDLTNIVAKDLSNGNAIGWFQGRMEFGPRALGARSILADPRSEKMQKNLNLKVKFRESFRPFAPSILESDLTEWFDLKQDSPYMLIVANIKKDKIIEMSDVEKKLFGIEKLNIKRSSVPAITHVDYSARIQTVHENTNKKYFKLISKFKKITGCPILVNTSFNVRGEPIVNTPEDAFRCFMGTGLDKLIIENCYLEKDDQDQNLKEKNYINNFTLD